MKPRFILTLSSLTFQNSKTIKNSHNFSTTINSRTPQNHATYFAPRPEEETRAVRVSVWWDFENCNIPCDTNVFTVAQCVTNAVRTNGIKGPVHITAFGDLMQMSRTNQEALSSTGISLNHVPSGGKNSADISLLVDLMLWVSQNPPPVHLFLISGDKGLAGILHRLRMNNYNILLASPDSDPSVLCTAATIMWQWSSLLKGENLSGKLFNHPPDGPHGSWYGHFRGTIENPFPVKEQSSCLPVEEESNCKQRPIPKAVMKHIQQILQSNPKGVLVVQLREALKNCDLKIDKDLYGYNKFTQFLSAMPQVLKLHPVKDGQFLVISVNSKFLEKGMSSVKVPVINHRELELNSPPRKSSGPDVPEKLIAVTIPEEKTESQELNMPESQNKEKQRDFSPLKKPELNAKEQVKNSRGAQKEEKMDKFSEPGKIEEIRVNHAIDLQDKTQKEAALMNTQEIGYQDKSAYLTDEQTKVEETSHIEVKEIPERNGTREDANNKHTSHAKIGFVRRISNWWFGPGASDTDSDKKLVGGGDTEETKMASKDLISPLSHEPEPNMSKQTTSCGDCESEVEKTAEKVTDQIKDNSKQLGLF